MALHSQRLFDEDPPAGFDGLFIWDYLNPAFQEATGRKITLMDIDAHCEINGQHLVIETKRAGVAVPQGQRKALLALWAKGYHLVIFLIGKEEPIECEIFYPNGFKQRQFRGQVTKKSLHDLCLKWAKWADKHSCPFQYSPKEEGA